MNLRQQRALKTKQLISDTAIKLFNEKGFRNVTVDEIIEKSGTSKGAFYTHFKSKHSIFLAKFMEIDDYYENELIEIIEKETSSIAKLRIFVRLQMQYIEQDLGWDVTRTIYENELNTERESFFLNPDRPLYVILLKIFREGLANRELNSDYSPEDMLTLWVRGMRGILYDWSIHKGTFSLADEQEMLFDVLLRGLRSKKG